MRSKSRRVLTVCIFFFAAFVLANAANAALWSGCDGDEFGDKKSGWFGWFWSDGYGGGWLCHYEHEWLCAFGNDDASIWFWHPAMGWLWTRDTVYPFLWSGTGKAWLWYYKGTGGWFLNFKTGEVQWRGNYPSAVPESFALIPAGEFQMGDNFNEGWDDELPVHTVYVSAFYMGVTEVTYGQWKEVYNWAASNGYSFYNAGSGEADNHPVHTVNWYDAVKWCNAKSEMEGLTPCYYTDSWLATVYRTGQIDIANDCVIWDTTGYRLPTEAEWEKAARGGLEAQRFPLGDTISHAEANYDADYNSSYDLSYPAGYHPDYDDGGKPYTSPAGSFAANGYGLYDMAGNVWEWCWDLHGSSYYGSSPGTDPTGPGPATGSNRVGRGGGWNSYARNCRSAYRSNSAPLGRGDDLGFRLSRRSD